MSPVPVELSLRRKELDEMGAISRFFQITLSFRYREPAETVRTMAQARAGRLNCRVRNPAEAEFVGENLL